MCMFYMKFFKKDVGIKVNIFLKLLVAVSDKNLTRRISSKGFTSVW